MINSLEPLINVNYINLVNLIKLKLYKIINLLIINNLCV